jgi:hypothetical protein
MHLLRTSYQNLLEIGRSRKGAIFLDIGSCSENHGIIIANRLIVQNTYILIVGTDARKLIADRYPLEQVVTSDLREGGSPFFSTQGHSQEVKPPLCLLCFCVRYLQNMRTSGINSSKRRKRHTQ